MPHTGTCTAHGKLAKTKSKQSRCKTWVPQTLVVEKKAENQQREHNCTAASSRVASCLLTISVVAVASAVVARQLASATAIDCISVNKYKRTGNRERAQCTKYNQVNQIVFSAVLCCAYSKWTNIKRQTERLIDPKIAQAFNFCSGFGCFVWPAKPQFNVVTDRGQIVLCSHKLFIALRVFTKNRFD